MRFGFGLDPLSDSTTEIHGEVFFGGLSFWRAEHLCQTACPDGRGPKFYFGPLLSVEYPSSKAVYLRQSPCMKGLHEASLMRNTLLKAPQALFIHGALGRTPQPTHLNSARIYLSIWTRGLHPREGLSARTIKPSGLDTSMVNLRGRTLNF